MGSHLCDRPKPARRLESDVVTCFAAATGCTATGALAGLANAIWPECTNLHGLLVVGGFYFICGVASLFGIKPGGARAADEKSAPALTRRPCAHGLDASMCGAAGFRGIVVKTRSEDGLDAAPDRRPTARHA